MITKNKLYRIENGENLIGGVCLGISEYLKIDYSTVKILFILMFLLTNLPIILIYIIMYIILPVKYEI